MNCACQLPLTPGGEQRRVDPAAGTQRDHFELLTMDGLLPAIGTPSSSGTSSSKPTTADGTVLHVAFAPRDPSILAVTSRASPDVPVGGSSSSSSSSSSAAIKRVSEPTLISNKDSTNEVWSAATIAAHAKITIWDMTRAFLAYLPECVEPLSLTQTRSTSRFLLGGQADASSPSSFSHTNRNRSSFILPVINSPVCT